jgi:hypothetical protein
VTERRLDPPAEQLLAPVEALGIDPQHLRRLPAHSATLRWRYSSVEPSRHRPAVGPFPPGIRLGAVEVQLSHPSADNARWRVGVGIADATCWGTGAGSVGPVSTADGALVVGAGPASLLGTAVISWSDCLSISLSDVVSVRCIGAVGVDTATVAGSGVPVVVMLSRRSRERMCTAQGSHRRWECADDRGQDHSPRLTGGQGDQQAPPCRLSARSTARVPRQVLARVQPIPEEVTTASRRAPPPLACSASRAGRSVVHPV